MRGWKKIQEGFSKKSLPIDLWSTVLTGAVLVVYIAMASGSATPGRSADLITKALALEPRLSPASSIWFALAYPLTLLPKAVLALNLFSALCAAVCVYLTGSILRKVVMMWSAEKMMSKEDGARLARIASLTGSTALALCPPFWSAALRADTGTFDTLLLLIWFTLCIRYVMTLRIPWAYAVMAWAGIGATQSVAFLWLAPLALLSFFGLLDRAIRVRVRGMAQLTAFLVIPYLVITVLQSLCYMGTEGHRLTGSLSLMKVAIELGWGQLLMMRQCVTTDGWLLGFLVVIAPWLACTGLMLRPQRKRNELKRGTVSERPALHTMATIMALGVFLDAPFSVWSIYGDSISWLTPVALSALAFGWLAAYWYRFAMRLPNWRLWRNPSILLPVRHVALAVTILILVKGTFGNAPNESKLMRTVVSAYVGSVVDAVGARPWLVTDGSLDSPILIDAHTKGLSLRTLNIMRMSDGLYREYMASRFSDAQVSNACLIGNTPLVRAWFGRGTNVADQVAVFTLPDLWYAAELQPEPNGLIFLGGSSMGAKASAPDEAWARNTNVWARLEPLLTACKSDPAAVEAFRKNSRRHMSFVANNMGVWLEDCGKPDLARQAYMLARQYEPYNVSALLNLGLLVQHKAFTNDAPAILAELKSLKEAKPTFDWWPLTRQYGYVRQAEAYAAMGLAWSLSGQPGITAVELNRALELSAAETNTQEVEALLAKIYAKEGQIEESRIIYERRLAARPDDRLAMIGLAQLALATNDTAAASAWLQRVDKTGQLKDGIDLVMANLYRRVGDLGRARVLTQAAIDRSYDNLSAWAIMAGVALEQKDAKAIDLCLREIHRLEKGRNFNGVLVEAFQALDKGDAPQARMLFDEALRIRPKSIDAMERVLRLDMMLGPRDTTPALARFLILIDSRNALAHYVLGVLHVRANEWASARPWLEKSVSLSPTAEALNDLAWVLMQQNELGLAEQHARDAVKRMPTNDAAWDTLGVILAEARRYDEAVASLERAISLRGRQPVLLAHLARVRIGQGNKPEALLLLQEAGSVKRALIPQEEEEIRAVRQLIKGK
jgi:tetratricopeptide (TPR) repeat protein